jgi:hypothetical protein
MAGPGRSGSQAPSPGILNGYTQPMARRFPTPWSVDDIGGCFVVKAGNGQPVIFIYYGGGVGRRSLARLLTRDAARRIAAGIAKLPDLVQRLSKAPH